MLYIDTDLRYFYFRVEDIAKEIDARPDLRKFYTFSKICLKHLVNLGRGKAELYTKNVNYFKAKTKSDQLVELVCLRFKM